jgi:hypothetical protein
MELQHANGSTGVITLTLSPRELKALRAVAIGFQRFEQNRTPGRTEMELMQKSPAFALAGALFGLTVEAEKSLFEQKELDAERNGTLTNGDLMRRGRAI